MIHDSESILSQGGKFAKKLEVQVGLNLAETGSKWTVQAGNRRKLPFGASALVRWNTRRGRGWRSLPLRFAWAV